MAELRRRIASTRSLLNEYCNLLQQFLLSSNSFRVLRTINPSEQTPRTLYILDSSFNPPSIAHLTLARSALTQPSPPDHFSQRLLLLFSVHNADKAAAPAPFEHRLVMMTLFAEDLSDLLNKRITEEELSEPTESPIPIDIGITNAPYYTDKTAAIESARPAVYPGRPRHVHLLGYDTFVRFLDPKYYQDSDPPLAALAPYFRAGHRLRVTQRPEAGGDDSSDTDLLERLRLGELEPQGAVRDWANQITMVEANADAKGVSSTKIREGARTGDWATVSGLCTIGVAAWIREMGIYSTEG